VRDERCDAVEDAVQAECKLFVLVVAGGVVADFVGPGDAVQPLVCLLVDQLAQ
jgi:hypothetical protein